MSTGDKKAISNHDADEIVEAISKAFSEIRPEPARPRPSNKVPEKSFEEVRASKRWWPWGRKRRLSVKSSGLSKTSETIADLRMEDHKFDLKLKKSLGRTVGFLLVAQFLMMNVVFVGYISYRVFWQDAVISDTLLIAWLTTSIVEIVGLATVIAKYLFPEAGSNWAKEPESK